LNKEELLESIDEALFEFSLSINEEFGGYHQDIPEKYHIVFVLLSRYETLYVKDLARLLHLSSSSVSQLLSQMEKEEYIIRELDPDRRSHTFVKLGKNGLETVQKMKETRNEISSKYLMQLSHDDLVQFREISIKLKNIVKATREETHETI